MNFLERVLIVNIIQISKWEGSFLWMYFLVPFLNQIVFFGLWLSIKNIPATSHTQPPTCQDDSYGTLSSCLKPLQLIFTLRGITQPSTYISQPIACNLLKGVHLSISWPAKQQAWLSSTHAKALLENVHPVLNPIFAGPFCLICITTEYVFSSYYQHAQYQSCLPIVDLWQNMT